MKITIHIHIQNFELHPLSKSPVFKVNPWSYSPDFTICFLLGSIPWFITAELFNQDSRPAAVSIAVLVNWMANFLVGIGFPLMEVRNLNVLFSLSPGGNMPGYRNDIALTSLILQVNIKSHLPQS